MKVFVIGGGGREHGIIYALHKSPKITELFCAPGNAGIEKLAKCVPIKATAIDELVKFAREEKFDLVFVAPEDPLALGLCDRLEEEGIRSFGPKANAARIEASKVFSKTLMKKYDIPTADFAIFSQSADAFSYLQTVSFPVVIKADGLALGKGVVIANDLTEAQAAVHAMMEEAVFQESGKTILIEEYLEGPELTVLAFMDGEHVLPMISSRDHKRVFDADQGKNTGGMGAVTPGTQMTEDEEKQLYNTIFLPTVRALREEGCPFTGIIYFGLMLTADGPKVIEYNARMGDPETQAILPRLQNDFLDVILACLDKRLPEIHLEWKPGASCCVVLASGGYPENYETGYPIEGLEKTSRLVFHAGTKIENQRVVTAGGRVLAVYGEGADLEEAIEDAYTGVSEISFKDMHFRKDIGKSSC